MISKESVWGNLKLNFRSRPLRRMNETEEKIKTYRRSPDSSQPSRFPTASRSLLIPAPDDGRYETRASARQRNMELGEMPRSPWWMSSPARYAEEMWRRKTCKGRQKRRAELTQQWSREDRRRTMRRSWLTPSPSTVERRRRRTDLETGESNKRKPHYNRPKFPHFTVVGSSTNCIDASVPLMLHLHPPSNTVIHPIRPSQQDGITVQHGELMRLSVGAEGILPYLERIRPISISEWSAPLICFDI